MEATQGKPVRKIRRWLIAAMTLFLAVGVALHWPSSRNLDPRLIGDWQGGPIVRRFNADGTYEMSGPFPIKGYVWSVEGSEIVVSKRSTYRSRFGSWVDWLKSNFTRQASISMNLPRYELVEVTGDKLRIKPIRPPRDMAVEVYDRKQ
ncbi:hypothetical protein AYO47_06540 [Planctomyces sp. SCGC AG-212-M04]|nr:hypothetical protein AYO47_06540 [Planctomyces sp. SCGC AG-212-M04]